MSDVNAAVLTIASWVLVAVLAVMFGAAMLRLVGIAFMVVSTVFLLAEAYVDTADVGSYLVFGTLALIGVPVWLLGHRLHRAQSGYWRSPLAASLWGLPGAVLGRPGPGRVGRM